MCMTWRNPCLLENALVVNWGQIQVTKVRNACSQPAEQATACLSLTSCTQAQVTSMEPCAHLLGRNCMKKGRGERKGWRGCIWPHFNNYRDDRWEGRLYSFTIIYIEFSDREDNSTPLKLSLCKCTHGYLEKHPNGGDRYSIYGLWVHRM